MKIKYPRTFHFEWSEGCGSDDKIQYDLTNFLGKEIIITEKMDGENSTMMRDYYYARSLDSNNHPSRNYVKGLWGSINYLIPENFRICGENLYARHSIGYSDLESYFMVFSIWDGERCLSWDETLEYCDLLGLVPVRVLHRGIFDLDFIKSFSVDTDKMEGYVVRLSGEFGLSDFQRSVVKWVRKGHVQTDVHWMNQKIIPNLLKI